MAIEKHTIYVDVDDEITAIIDKVKNAPGKIIALVLPKRATVLQSIINMKLLKKSALSAKKSLVLITSEQGLMPLAGAVGLHVAASLQTKPAIPSAPTADEPEDEAINEDAQTVAVTTSALEDETEAIELDNATDTSDVVVDKSKSKSKKGFIVPNFDRFRLRLILGISALVLLILGWFLAFIILPKATVLISTDSSTTAAKLDFTASTSQQELNVDKAVVPAESKEVKKTDTEKTTATGKKDNGTKAVGTITIKNCEDTSSRTVPAGTTLTATGKNYITDTAVVVSPGTFSNGGTNCTSAVANVGVTAAENGDKYNQDAGPYTTSSSALQGGFRINGSAMTGGASKVISVVSQEDVDVAASKMKGRLDGVAKKELTTQLLQASLKPLEETLVISAPTITASPAVGSEAVGEVTITAITTYNIMGVKSTYLSQIIKKNIEGKIDLTKQTILDDGLDAVAIHIVTRKSPTEVSMNLQTLVIAGPQLNPDNIKNEIKGKKRGSAESIIKSKVGVKDVTITYSPFWVYSTPNSLNKIIVTIQKPVVTKALNPSVNP